MRWSSPRLYFETVRRLRPEQVRHQVRRRIQWPAFPTPPVGAVPTRSGWGPRVQRCRPAVTSDVVSGEFAFWNRTRRIDLDQPWNEVELGRSWNYLVHYFEFLPVLAEAVRDDPVQVRSLCKFVDRWLTVHPPGTLPGWDPYPTALRVVSWVDALHALENVAEPSWRERVLASIHVQSDWLHRRLERHLLGTHLLKDAKALLIAASVVDTPAAARWRRTATALLRRELAAHVGADGVHVEPTLMYHCTALEDVLDLLNWSGAVDAPTAAALADVGSRMLDAAVATATPAGGTALLGDAWEGGAPSPVELQAYAARLGLAPPAEPESGPRLYPNAGLLVWRDERLYVLADVGGIGPPHLSGHGHCDSLSFEVWSDGVPFLVDSGTFSYEAGELRQACRATRAHNTIEIDSREQHEIWAAFRVARRSRVQVTTATATEVEAELVPWFDKRLQVQRRYEWQRGELRVHDRVVGPGTHQVTSRLHVHPHCRIEPVASGVVLHHGMARLGLSWRGGSRAVQWLLAADSGSRYAARAGDMHANAVAVLEHTGQLPFTSTLRLEPLDPA